MTIQEICVNYRSIWFYARKGSQIQLVELMLCLNALKSSKTDDDTIRVSIKLFDHEQIMKTRSIDISEVEEFPLSEFVPRGQTALLRCTWRFSYILYGEKAYEPTSV